MRDGAAPRTSAEQGGQHDGTTPRRPPLLLRCVIDCQASHRAHIDATPWKSRHFATG
jgi:hypothetical protein